MLSGSRRLEARSESRTTELPRQSGPRSANVSATGCTASRLVESSGDSARRGKPSRRDEHGDLSAAVRDGVRILYRLDLDSIRSIKADQLTLDDDQGK